MGIEMIKFGFLNVSKEVSTIRMDERKGDKIEISVDRGRLGRILWVFIGILYVILGISVSCSSILNRGGVYLFGLLDGELIIWG